MKLIFASRNPYKLIELKAILGEQIHLIGMEEAGVSEDIPETADTLEGNAYLKAKFIYDILEENCIAEDTGLEVEALGMRPGVHSARYAGDAKNALENMEKLLAELEGEQNRKARFRSVISLIIDGACYFFEGQVAGTIAHKPKGKGGFGYDPIFIPEGYSRSFGELEEDIKINISHRTRAMQACISFLRQYIKCKNPQLARLQK